MQDQPARCIRMSVVKLGDVVPLTTGYINQQRGIWANLDSIEKHVTDVEEVEPLLAICSLTGHECVEVAHHRWVINPPREHVVLRLVRVLKRTRRSIDVLEVRLF